MATASLIMTAAGGIYSAWNQYQSGKAQESMAKHNARILEQDAKLVEQEARENAKRERKNNERELAAVRARLAGQGAALDAGAPLSIMNDVASELELSVLDNYREANRRRNNLLQEASNTRYQGELAKNAGKTALLGTLISTAGSAANQYATGKQIGLFSTSQKPTGQTSKQTTH